MSKDFLEKMVKAGEENSEDDFFLTVAKMKIQLGYSGFVSGERPSNFFKPYNDPKDATRVSEEVKARLKEIGSQRGAVFAIMLNIPQETNTGREALGGKVTWDIEQVTFINNDEKSEYQILINALADYFDFPFDEWFWGSYKNEVVGEYEKDGETKKRYLSIPVQKFANEAEAMATVNISGGASVTSQWSDTVRANHPDPENFESKYGDEIRETYKIVLESKAKPYHGAPDLPQGFADLSPIEMDAAVKVYLSHVDLYGCTPKDIDAVLTMTPF